MTSESGKFASRPTPEGVLPPAASAEHAKRVAELFEQYHNKLVKSLLPQTRSREEAQDIAAQAFTELLALDQPGKVSFLGAYLYRTARNLLKNQWRGRSVRRKDEALAGYDPLAPDGSPEPQWSDLERLQVLRRAIDRLPPRCHNVLVLRVWHGLTYEEIVTRLAASGLSVTTRTVERDIAFAIEFCRRKLRVAEGAVGKGDV
jgi:RNA polymerase sigma-70 factor (ECF subfamily)